mgnify:CR=1 FL=1
MTVIVDAAVDRVHGMHTRLVYPAGLSIPGGAEEESVKERITFIPVQAAIDAGHPFPLALPTVNDQEYRVPTLLSSLDSFAVGPFVTVTFDCTEGRTRPAADDFPCEVAGATDLQFLELYDSTCRAELVSSS